MNHFSADKIKYLSRRESWLETADKRNNDRTKKKWNVSLISRADAHRLSEREMWNRLYVIQLNGNSFYRNHHRRSISSRPIGHSMAYHLRLFWSIKHTLSDFKLLLFVTERAMGISRSTNLWTNSGMKQYAPRRTIKIAQNEILISQAGQAAIEHTFMRQFTTQFGVTFRHDDMRCSRSDKSSCSHFSSILISCDSWVER